MQIVSGVKIDPMISKPNFQLKAQLLNSEMTTETIFYSAIDIVRLWLHRKLYNNPTIAHQLDNIVNDISIDYGSVTVNTTYLSSIKKWACRYKQPDNEILARTWVTQTIIEINNDEVYISVVNSCVYPESSTDPVPLTTPAFIRTLAEQIGLYEQMKIDNKPWHITDSASLQTLKAIIENDKRLLPIILVSEKRYTRDMESQSFSIDPITLAEKSLALAHIITIPYNLTFEFSELVGKKWSVFEGAIRTYIPGLDFKYSDIYQHPLALADRIATWVSGSLTGADAFVNSILNYLKRFNSQISIYGDYVMICTTKFNEKNYQFRFLP